MKTFDYCANDIKTKDIKTFEDVQTFEYRTSNFGVVLRTLCKATRRSMSSSVCVGHGSVEAALVAATGLAEPLEPCRSPMIGELPAISEAFDSSEMKMHICYWYNR